jgi:hypothetical protein
VCAARLVRWLLDYSQLVRAKLETGWDENDQRIFARRMRTGPGLHPSASAPTWVRAAVLIWLHAICVDPRQRNLVGLKMALRNLGFAS